MNPGYPPPPPPGYGYPPPGYYPPGSLPPPGYGQPPRSSTPKTLGTLSIVFGGIVALLNLVGLLAGKQFGQMMDTTHISKAAFDRYLSDIHGVTMALTGVMFVMSLSLIWIGIGQRGYKRWALKASQWWGLAALVFLLVQLIVNLTVVMPAMDRLLDSIHASAVRGTMGAMMKIGIFTGILFYAPYPLVLITSFRKQANIDVMDQD